MLASRVVQFYKGGLSIDTAVSKSIGAAEKQFPSISCGIIAITADGSMSARCNSRTFTIARASRDIAAFDRVPCGMSIIQPLCFYRDEMVMIGLSNHPTLLNQAIFKLRSGHSFTELNEKSFKVFFNTLRRVASVMAHRMGVASVALMIFPNDKGGFLFPIGKDIQHRNPILDRKREYRLAIGDSYNARVTKDSIIIVGSNDHEHIFTSPEAQFHKGVQAVWAMMGNGLRKMMERKEWALLFDPLSDCLMSAGLYPDMSWPKPAPFHQKHPGYFETGLGPRVPVTNQMQYLAVVLKIAISTSGYLG